MCHHCLHSSEVPERCAVCGKTLRRIGPGTQRAEEEILRKFPGMRLQRVDSDATKPRMLEGILADFGAGRIDGLIGTQMVGKGLDFPNVELVGVLHADTALSLPDFRSTERTFQLVAQVAGRCGRAEGTGRAVVQSFVPEEPAIQYACRHDYEAFAEEELEVRRRCGMPPFRRLARIILRDEKLAKLEVVGKRLRAEIDGIISEAEGSVEARGPIPAAIARLERYHRQEILLKAPQAGPLQRLLSRLRTEALGKLGVQAVVDVDPINLL